MGATLWQVGRRRKERETGSGGVTPYVVGVGATISSSSLLVVAVSSHVVVVF